MDVIVVESFSDLIVEAVDFFTRVCLGAAVSFLLRVERVVGFEIVSISSCDLTVVVSFSRGVILRRLRGATARGATAGAADAVARVLGGILSIEIVVAVT